MICSNISVGDQCLDPPKNAFIFWKNTFAEFDRCERLVQRYKQLHKQQRNKYARQRNKYNRERECINN